MGVINMGIVENKREVKVRASLNKEIKKRLVELLCEYTDVFTWPYQDMYGLDTSIIVHKLPINLECPPVKQKLRRTRSDISLKIREEVRK